ncbi:MAG: O-antigen ligase family protein [Chloroflexaceae bacterium]|nr:O-antigen ligase family protein [Chloroflexaceae bacterium]
MPRLLPFAINANVMAGVLIVLLPFPLAFVLFSGQRTSCTMLILADVSTLMMLSILVATQSRGAIGALLVIILIIFILRWRYGWLMALASAGSATLALLVTGIGRITEFTQSSGLQRTIETRVEIWSRAWDIVQDFPFTGIGMGTFAQITNVLYPFFMNDPGIPHAHNLYLHIALDLGILGLVAWLALCITSVRASWGVYTHGMLTGDRWLTGLGLGLLCSQVALLVHGITDSVVWVDAPTAALVWGVWGIALAARHLHEPGKA